MKADHDNARELPDISEFVSYDELLPWIRYISYLKGLLQ